MIKRVIKRISLIVFSVLLITSTFSQFAAATGVHPAQPGPVQYVPGEVIVGLKRSADQAQVTQLIKGKGGTVIQRLDALKAVVAKVSEERVEAFMEKIRESSLVRYVERNGKVMLTLTPNDPGWSNQWGPQKIQADTAWNTQTGDKSILVAVVDTGVDWNHPDLAANYVALGYDWWNYDSDPMDDHGHGTHCAGIIAAVLNNGKGMAGLAQVRVMAEKFLSSDGWGTFEDAASALRHAADAGADIISNSWGAYWDSELVHDAVKYAYNKGALLVAAAGNDGWDWPLYPAAYDEVVAVTATDQSDNPAWFTNFGNWVEVAAPGVDIYSTVWDDSYASWSGTSMATPHAAGVAALIWSQFPSMTRDQVRARLKDTADDLGDPGFDIYYGYGRINARKAVGTSAPSAPSGLTATAVSSSQINLAWTDNSADESDFHIERKEGSGGTWSDISTVGANMVSYQDTGLSASTTYYYRVRAHRHSDNLYSGYSNEASATTSTLPSGSYALSFNGKNDYMNCGTDSSLDITDAITIEAWVKSNDATGSHGVLEKYSTWGLTQYAGNWEFQYKDSANNWHRAYKTGIQEGVWTHIVGTYDGTVGKIYVNAEVGTNAGAGTGTLASAPANKLYIGRIAWTQWIGRGVHFNGAMDEVRIYNRAISSEEITYSYQNEAPQDQNGLVMWLRMNEGSGSTTYDETANNNDGTIQGATWVEDDKSQEPPPPSGSYALSFDGGDDCVEVLHSSSLNIADGITLEAWIKPNQIPSSRENAILVKGRGAERYSLYLMSDGTVRFELCIAGVGYRQAYTPTISAGIWTHVVGTFDGSTMKAYANAVAGTPISVSGSIATCNINLLIGSVNQAGYYFDGTIDEVRIYNRAISSEEITYSYQNEAPQDQNGLVMWLRMNEGSGSTTYDETANNNDGTIQGATWVSTA